MCPNIWCDEVKNFSVGTKHSRYSCVLTLPLHVNTIQAFFFPLRPVLSFANNNLTLFWRLICPNLQKMALCSEPRRVFIFSCQRCVLWAKGVERSVFVSHSSFSKEKRWCGVHGSFCSNFYDLAKGVAICCTSYTVRNHALEKAIKSVFYTTYHCEISWSFWVVIMVQIVLESWLMQSKFWEWLQGRKMAH
jgi:hypothetical protein